MINRVKLFILLAVCSLLLISTKLFYSADHIPIDADTINRYIPLKKAAVLGDYHQKPEANEKETTAYESESPSTRVNAAFVALVRNSELAGLRSTVRQIEDRFNRKYKYPYIFLNDVPFTEEFKRGMSFVTDNEIRYGMLNASDWSIPKHLDPAKVFAALEKNKSRYIYGGSLSYRYMCRFQSGLFYDHPLLKDLEYYWRIEPDVNYYCDLDYDPFVFMKENGKRYSFTIAPLEWEKTVETLWPTTLTWIKENPHHLPEESMINWVMGNNGDYNMCHFWSNFEIVDLSLYRSEAYRSYFDHLDKSGGFFYERWGDAPIHSIAASMFLKKSEIHWFEDIGYKHPGNEHCPRPEEMALKCVCDSSRSYTYRSRCQRRFSLVQDVKKEELLQKVAQRLIDVPPASPQP
ncbi:alpha-1,2-mannosyltransferase ktr1 [Mycoemilia scoparia]|uniref:Alpha-1,2-mannosyltransferase ktr1 n=1 Tax=Mycoemilia scoparia TaxID=417184 RepID=A0A9W8DQN3_9FUNG|nr:alpha-1,2-mannosyltransferase ktr1 [Mycoemilia scoparia]